jgi:hypothetical protein
MHPPHIGATRPCLCSSTELTTRCPIPDKHSRLGDETPPRVDSPELVISHCRIAEPRPRRCCTSHRGCLQPSAARLCSRCHSALAAPIRHRTHCCSVSSRRANSPSLEAIVRACVTAAWSPAKMTYPAQGRFCSNSRHVCQGFAIKCRRFSLELTITLCSRPSRPSTLLSLITQLTSRHALCYPRHHGRLVVPDRAFPAYQSVRHQFAAHDAASRLTCQP